MRNLQGIPTSFVRTKAFDHDSYHWLEPYQRPPESIFGPLAPAENPRQRVATKCTNYSGKKNKKY